MRTGTSWRRVVMAGVVALALTACTADGGGRPPVAARDKESPTATAPAPAPVDPAGTEKEGTAPPPAPAATERAPLPLDALFDEAASGVQLVAKQRVEELTAECMAAEGHLYIPYDHSVGDVDPTPTGYGTREFAEEYGYGITTDAWVEFEDWYFGEPLPDPNAEHLETLPPDQHEAYYVALYGDQSIFDDFTDADWETYVWDWRSAGCSGWAGHEVYGDQDDDVTRFDPLWEAVEAMYGAFDRDPRVTSALGSWSACMAQAGYPGLRQAWEAESLVSGWTTEVYEMVYPDDLDWGTMTEARMTALDQVYRVRLSEFAEAEIAVAVADFDCRQSSGYDDVEYEVMVEYQTDFVATHRAELEAYVEFMG